MTEDHILWEPLSKKVLSSVRYYPSLKNNTILHCRSTMLFSRSVVSDCLWPHGLQHTWLPLSLTITQSLLKLMSIESVMPSKHLVLCWPLLLLPSLPALGSFPMCRLFTSGGHIIGASASVFLTNIQGWFFFFRTDWFDLLAVQETLVPGSLVPLPFLNEAWTSGSSQFIHCET